MSIPNYFGCGPNKLVDIVDLSVNFIDCNQNRRSRHKIVEILSFPPATGGVKDIIN
ncbi:MAG: hypothetical protein LBR79_06170 [Oscillospiraceae bacterium]|nr:hypothetical protein [Oscillospiraceae bacterium]